MYWFISLAGNMLWAATVFFPPAAPLAAAALAAKAAAVAAGPSLATKAASLLGAALGSNVLGQLKGQPVSIDAAKSFLRDVMAKRQDQLYALYVGAADDWIYKNLSSYVTGQLMDAASEKEWEKSHRTQIFSEEWPALLTDQLVESYMSKVTNIDEMYDYTLKGFLFPGAGIGSADVNKGLRNFMVTEMNSALKDFMRQYNEWSEALGHYCYHATEGERVTSEDMGDPPGVPVAYGSRRWFEVRTRQFEVKKPFRPRLKFTGLPKSVQDRTVAADIGDIMVSWKYGISNGSTR